MTTSQPDDLITQLVRETDPDRRAEIGRLLVERDALTERQRIERENRTADDHMAALLATQEQVISAAHEGRDLMRESRDLMLRLNGVILAEQDYRTRREHDDGERAKQLLSGMGGIAAEIAQLRIEHQALVSRLVVLTEHAEHTDQRLGDIDTRLDRVETLWERRRDQVDMTVADLLAQIAALRTRLDQLEQHAT